MTTSPTGERRRAPRFNFGKLPPALFIGISLAYFLIPVWWLIVATSKSNAELIRASGFWFTDISSLDNLHQTMTQTDGLFPRWLLNSVIYSGSAALLGCLFATMAGYVLAKFQFRGKQAVSGMMLIGILVPGALLTIPLYFVISAVGLTNSIWAVIIPCCFSPFGVYLVRAYAEGAVPDEILEAARVDGAGEYRIFFLIVVKILSPIMVTVFLFIFVGTWNNFMLPLVMLNDNSLYPVTLGLFGWQSYLNQNYQNIVLMGSLIAVVPLVIAFFALQRYWRAGLTIGGVKG